ncbi:MAG: HAD hydrolase family protein [Candidatus Bathyarchaeota archaeon]|nr:HAD hydrolase family protein [Candidatus Bathyarchaeota archaeon]
MKRVFISDCEGPISKNDNAFELTAHFVPDGDKLFTVISKYDDVLADVLKRPRYKAGDTLKLILPFLKAYDVTDRKMREFSAQNLILISSVKKTLQHVRKVTHAFIVSTSYEHYMRALCKAIAFPYENTYCTKLNIDKYHIAEKEKAKLKEFAKEIAKMSMLMITKNTKSIEDFSEKDQKIIRRLDEIFWIEIASMESGRIFGEVNPVGGSEKAEAIKDVVRKVGVALADVMYVGDSITDIEAFKLVRENGGLAVSFNGNEYAVKNAEIAVLSENSIVTAVIADAFATFGKEQTLRLVENWTHEALAKSRVNKTLLANLFRLYPGELPKVKIITSENMETLAKESSDFRKKVRGEAIGQLG